MIAYNNYKRAVLESLDITAAAVMIMMSLIEMVMSCSTTTTTTTTTDDDDDTDSCLRRYIFFATSITSLSNEESLQWQCYGKWQSGKYYVVEEIR